MPCDVNRKHGIWVYISMMGTVQPCTADDATCYCTPLGDCFPLNQEIKIDHCDIDQYKSNAYQLDFVYVVVNLAGLESTENTIQVCSLHNIFTLYNNNNNNSNNNHHHHHHHRRRRRR